MHETSHACATWDVGLSGCSAGMVSCRHHVAWHVGASAGYYIWEMTQIISIGLAMFINDRCSLECVIILLGRLLVYNRLWAHQPPLLNIGGKKTRARQS